MDFPIRTKFKFKIVKCLFSFLKVNQKSSELEVAKSKLRLLGQDLVPSEASGGGSGGSSSSRADHHDDAQGGSRQQPQQQQAQAAAGKASENRVHFDLRTTTRSVPAPTRLKTTLTTTAAVTSGMTMGTRRLLPGPHMSQLPSDARQRLEEMVKTHLQSG